MKQKEFIYYFDGSKSKCHIRILSEKGKIVVMCSQFYTYGGRSITNAIEEIAKAIKTMEKLDGDITWVEHYGKGIGLERGYGSYATVEFDDNGKPSWSGGAYTIDDIAETTKCDKKYFETPSEVKCQKK